MRRVVATVVLVLALVLAGCAGGGSGTASPATDSPAGTPTDSDTVETPVPLADEHPYVTDGSLDVRALVTAHVQRLRGLDSYTLGNNVTAEFVANGSTVGEVTRVDRVDLADERVSRLIRTRELDSSPRERLSYRNATHACSGLRGSVTCGEAVFDGDRITALALETTSLETVAGPAFEPDGTVTRNGQGLYRYTATTLREDLSEDTTQEFGTDPALSNATLLVDPSGRVVEYRLTYTYGSDAQRQRGTFVYTTRGVNATSVPDGEQFVSG